jgi:peptidoglycan/LPS O-acetylase OafA/YrhL
VCGCGWGSIGFGGIYDPEPGAAGALRHHPRWSADAAVWLHRSGTGGENPLAYALGVRPLVFVGEASYCLYLLHFNLWNLIHGSHVLDALGLSRFDPWLSYVLLIGLAILALYFIEKPAQRKAARVDACDDGGEK